MKEKRYILMTIEESNYDNFERYFYKIFNNYKELQYHLIKFNNTPKYVIFEETNLKKDNSFKIYKRFKGNNFYE
jgi:hypothetical protein